MPCTTARPRPCPPRLLGGQVGLEDARPGRLVHSDAVVLHPQRRLRARLARQWSPAPGRRMMWPVGPTASRALAQRLSTTWCSWVRSASTVPTGGRHGHLERDRRGDRRAHQAQAPRDDLERSSGSRLGWSLRPKVRICRTRSRARSRGLLDDGEALVRSAEPRRHLLERDLRAAHDGRQQVVEVVRHAAGEPADGLQLLGVPQLLVQGGPVFERLRRAR